MSNKIADLLTAAEEKFKAIKQKFNGIPAVPVAAAADPNAAPAPAAPTTYKLADGVTIVMIDKLENGGKVTINDLPAPEGQHLLEDGTKITTDVNGVITAIEKPAPAAAAQPAPADFSTLQGVQAVYAAFADGNLPTDIVSQMLRVLMEDRFGYQLREKAQQEALDAYREQFSQATETINALREVIKEQSEVSEQVFSAVKEMAGKTVEDPAQPIRTAFGRSQEESLSYLERIGQAHKNNIK